MRYWAMRHGRNWSVLERTLPICKTFGEGEDTYVDEFSNDDDGSDSEGNVEKQKTAPFRVLSCAR